MNVADSKMSRYPFLQFSSRVAFHGSSFSQFKKDRFTLNLAASLAVVQDLSVGWVKFSLSFFLSGNCVECIERPSNTTPDHAGGMRVNGGEDVY